MFKILLAEDDRHTAKLMNIVLKNGGYEVENAYDGEQALNLYFSQHFDLVVLDIMMPGVDGYEVARQIRAADGNVPILITTAKHLPEDKRMGFLAGTDDYMVKPIDTEEFLLRVKALLRRAKIANERKLHIGEVTLDYESMSVIGHGETFTLPQKEFLLLFMLLSYPNRIFTRIQIMDEIWGADSNSTEFTINVHINRLRKKFNDWEEFKIVSIRGVGYKAVIT
ncbi:MAG: response regulator transcription factor [Clostridia bacterium]|nr:response regulator transcription factor [Clostridia bacterium]